MKKIFYWISAILLCIGLSLAIFLPSFTPKRNNNTPFTSTTQHDQYSDKLKDIVNTYSNEDEEQYTINKSDLTSINGQYYVSANLFAKTINADLIEKDNTLKLTTKDNLSLTYNHNNNSITTDTKISYLSANNNILSSENTLLPLKDITTELKYDLTEEDETIKITNIYQTKRLIVKSANQNLDTCGAVAVADGYKDYHIFQYKSIQETITALEYYKSHKDVSNVFVDSYISSTSDYTTWGSDNKYTGSKGYKKNLDTYRNSLKMNNEDIPTVYIAVLDTGINTTHEVFTNRIALEYGYSYSNSSNSYYKFEDDNGHGTHVSSTITDQTPDNVKIIPIKVLNDKGSGLTSTVIDGIERILGLSNQGVNIRAINMSLGHEYSEPSYSSLKIEFESIINTALEDYNILSIVASGNESTDCKNYLPASIPNAITVSALIQNGITGEVSFDNDYSNYGAYIDFSAPGTNIAGAYIGASNVYATSSGTSMATPHITALVALLASDNSSNYSANQIESILKNTSIDLGDPGLDIYYGSGLPNIKNVEIGTYDSIQFYNGTEIQNSTYCLNPIDLTIKCTTNNTSAYCEIYYTLDGSTPTDESILYTAPINISSSTRIRAIAYIKSKQDNSLLKTTAIEEITLTFSGSDIINPFSISSKGVLTSYSGVLTSITVPETIYEPISEKNITVTSIGPNAFANLTIRYVTLPSTITSIQENAFNGCVSLQKITASEVTTIGDFAFDGCLSLRLENSNLSKIETIGNYAFNNCTYTSSFSSSTLTKLGSYAFNGCTKLNTINFANLTQIAEHTFNGCTKLASISLPKVQTIGEYAFYNCESITGTDSSSSTYKYSFPELTHIAKFAFYNTAKTGSEFNLPKVVYIGDSAFEQQVQDATTSSTFKLDNLEHISNYSFYNSNITNLIAPNLKHVGDNAFQNSLLSSIDIPKIQTIGVLAFYGTKNLSSMTLPSSLEVLYEGTFDDRYITSISGYYGTLAHAIANSFDAIFTQLDANYASYLTYELNSTEDAIIITGYKSSYSGTITIPEYINGYPVTEIKDSALSGSNIKTISSVVLTKIGANAFNNCTNLETIYLPHTIEIKESAFNGCTSLINVQINQIETIGNYAFVNCPSLVELSLPISLKQIGTKALGYTDASFDEKVSNFSITGFPTTPVKSYCTNHGFTFNSIYTELSQEDFGFKYEYSDTKTNGSSPQIVTITITYIDPHAFGAIAIPESIDGINITKIAPKAFANCEFITDVYLPETITTIEEYAFNTPYENNALRYTFTALLNSIVANGVTTIGTNAFSNCSKLFYTEFNNLQSIGSSAFSDNLNLKTINLSKLTTLESYTFYNCVKLTNINLNNAITISAKALYNCSNIKELNLQNATTIGFSALERCSFTSISVPKLIDLEYGLSGDFTSLYLPKITEFDATTIIDTEHCPNLTKLVVGSDCSSIIITTPNTLSSTVNTNVVVYGYPSQDPQSPTAIEQLVNDYNLQFKKISSNVTITQDLNLLYKIEKTTNGTIDLTIDLSDDTFEPKIEWFKGTPNSATNLNISEKTITIPTNEASDSYYFARITSWDGKQFVNTINARVVIIESFSTLPDFTITITINTKNGATGSVSIGETIFTESGTIQIEQYDVLSLKTNPSADCYIIDFKINSLSYPTLTEYTNYTITNYTFEITFSKDFQINIIEQIKENAGDGLTDIYLSTSPTATSGKSNGSSFKSGTTVYYFAKINMESDRHRYQLSSNTNPELIEDTIYRLGYTNDSEDTDGTIDIEITTTLYIKINTKTITLPLTDRSNNLYLSSESNLEQITSSNLESGIEIENGEPCYLYIQTKSNTKQYSYTINTDAYNEEIIEMYESTLMTEVVTNLYKISTIIDWTKATDYIVPEIQETINEYQISVTSENLGENLAFKSIKIYNTTTHQEIQNQTSIPYGTSVYVIVTTNEITDEFGNPTSSINKPISNGYTFTRMQEDELSFKTNNFQILDTIIITITNDILTKEFSVTFYNDDGSYIYVVNGNKSQLVEYEGTPIFPIDNPDRTDCEVIKNPTATYWYEFDGWYTSINGGEKISKTIKLTSHKNFYARFKQYNITEYTEETNTLSSSSHLEEDVILDSEVLAENANSKLSIKFNGSSIAFETNSTEYFASQESDITFNMLIVPNASLSQLDKELANGKLVYSITAKANGSEIHEFNGIATVTINYTPKENENTDTIAVWYLKDGTLTKLDNVTYKDGKITFKTDHFSYFIVGSEYTNNFYKTPVFIFIVAMIAFMIVSYVILIIRYKKKKA